MVEEHPVRGNVGVWARFERDRPAVAFLEGAPGVGKFLGLSQSAARMTGPENIVAYQNMTMQDVRELADWLLWRSDAPKVAILEPGDCYPGVWTYLKSLLEELPEGHHVWVVSSANHPAPKSLVGLGYRYTLSLLTSSELGQAFQDAGTFAQDAQYLHTLGSVDLALGMNRALNVKPAVSSWLEAVDQSNRGLLLTATKTWEQRHTDLLMAELEKQLGKKTIVDGHRLSRVDKDRILRALTFLSDCPSPYIGAVTAGLSLMPGR